MYYVKTRADNSGYTNHRVICLVVIGSSFDSEQILVESVDPNLLTREDNSIQHFILVILPF
jgi:hypothetical protein